MARRDSVEVDFVSGIPDSGVAHAIGYSNEANIPYVRPFIKYNLTWSRSFIPQTQEVREQIARMKLMPIIDLIKGEKASVLRRLNSPRYTNEGNCPVFI